MTEQLDFFFSVCVHASDGETGLEPGLSLPDLSFPPPLDILILDSSEVFIPPHPTHLSSLNIHQKYRFHSDKITMKKDLIVILIYLIVRNLHTKNM